MPTQEEIADASRDRSSIRLERDCSDFEFVFRRLYSRLFYWGLYRLLHPDRPYYTPGAIRRILEINDRTKTAFEWGSGVSTVWWARRVRSITTIEHDRGWYERVGGWLGDAGLSSVDLRLVPLHEGSHADYCSAIDAYPDASFDLVAVDGRERVDCVKHAVPKLRRGGWLLLDDSHRARYRAADRQLRQFQAEIFDFGLLQTSLYRKL